ncbi:MAG TPA: tail fiber domain-containing protein [Chthoniobacterales bacterium]|jgi:hypothetical protein
MHFSSLHHYEEVRLVATSNSSTEVPIMNQLFLLTPRRLICLNPFILRSLLPILLACCAFLPAARAVTPAPDGGYPNNNTAEGDDALFSLTTGVDNTAIGFDALYSNTTGCCNTANGTNALYTNSTGYDNTAIGRDVLYYNTTGFNNTASGFGAMLSNTTGSGNTADGWLALAGNTTGYDNTAIGDTALNLNTIGIYNTAVGFQALFNNTTGYFNTANGVFALSVNTEGWYNTATGAYAGGTHTGSNNTATGAWTLYFGTTGANNTADGYQALYNTNTGGNNIAVGYQAGFNLTTGSNNIDIGNQGVAGEANTIRIGTVGTQSKIFVAGTGTPVVGPVVRVSSTGQLGIQASSARFKDQIKPMDKASEAILALKPVTFRYKKEIDPEGISQFGLVAEEVEKVNPDLVARDADGKPYTVRYEAVNAMLLNEFLKQHRKVEEQERIIGHQQKEFSRSIAGLEATIAQQHKDMAALAARLKQQEAQIQKVSAQIELSQPSPQTVLNQQ